MNLTQQSVKPSNVMQQREKQHGKQVANDINIKPSPKDFRRNFRLQTINAKKYSGEFYRSIIESMEFVKTNKKNLHPDEYYKEMGIPVPAQYEAFNKLYKFEGVRNYFNKHDKIFCNHSRLPRNPINLQLFMDIFSRYEKGEIKEITIACGSLWKKNPWVRYEIMEYLNLLCTIKGVKVNIRTNCSKKELNANHDEYKNIVKKFNSLIKNKKITFKCFKKRIMIHFVRIDDKYILIDFPHTEKHYLRLSILLTPKDLNSKPLIKEKARILKFFGNLIREAER